MILMQLVVCFQKTCGQKLQVIFKDRSSAFLRIFQIIQNLKNICENQTQLEDQKVPKTQVFCIIRIIIRGKMKIKKKRKMQPYMKKIRLVIQKEKNFTILLNQYTNLILGAQLLPG